MFKFAATAIFLLAVSLMPGCDSCSANSPLSPSGNNSNGKTQVWFTPNVASRDMLNLFSDASQWPAARSKIDVFKFYIQQASPSDNCQGCGRNVFSNFVKVVPGGAFKWLNSNSIKIGLEAGAVKDWNCGRVPTDAVETTVQAVSAIHASGAVVSYVAMDEPYVSVREWCRQPIEKVSEHVSYYIKRVNDSYPGVKVGLIEPYPFFTVEEIESFIISLEKTGVRLPFFHLDMHRAGALANSDIGEDLRNIEKFCKSRGIEFGVIVWGDNGGSNQLFFNSAMYTASTIRAGIGIPDHLIFQSWSEASGGGDKIYPDNLPEDSPMTFTWIVNQLTLYFGI